MIKIIASTPAKADGTSFYRMWGIFKSLSKLIKFEIIELPTSYQWPFLKDVDIFFLHRPFRADFIPVIRYAKELGAKVWIDHDDNLFTLPPENPSYDIYNKENVKNDMFKILKEADIITVSTEELRKFFDSKGFFNTQVIPNALDDKFPNSAPVNAFNEKKNFFWRGTPTHHGDLYDFQNEIFKAMGETDSVWNFFGYNPYFVTRLFPLERWKYYEPQDIIQYFKIIKHLKPHIMHVPLSDNYFNHCKSNIAWIEATMAGAVTVAPDWQEWQRPGVLNYKTPEEYQQILTNLPENLKDKWQESRDYIQENLLLSKVNLLRKQIIETLL